MNKPRIFGAWWWLWAITVVIASYFTGFALGKLIRKAAIYFALTQLTQAVIFVITVGATSFGVMKLIRWMETKIFGARGVLYLCYGTDKAA